MTGNCNEQRKTMMLTLCVIALRFQKSPTLKVLISLAFVFFFLSQRAAQGQSSIAIIGATLIGSSTMQTILMATSDAAGPVTQIHRY
jgi:hypothetical protein